jgi:hypothetical protein
MSQHVKRRCSLVLALSALISSSLVMIPAHSNTSQACQSKVEAEWQGVDPKLDITFLGYVNCPISMARMDGVATLFYADGSIKGTGSNGHCKAPSCHLMGSVGDHCCAKALTFWTVEWSFDVVLPAGYKWYLAACPGVGTSTLHCKFHLDFETNYKYGRNPSETDPLAFTRA